jgi:hypothetical protein
MCSVARTSVGSSMPIMAESSRNAFSYFAVYCWTLTPSRAASRIILSSTSVMFMTWRTVYPLWRKKAAQKVDGDKGAEVADVSVVVNGGAAGVHADFVVAKGMEFFDPRRHGIKKTKRHNEFEQRAMNSTKAKLGRTYDSRVGERAGQIKALEAGFEPGAKDACARADGCCTRMT